ncbi:MULTISPECIES: hypothetical protein [unclassified Paenibacillus]|uniref:hypothetical protein n=1 Tax=unclassified Paenibacillus TaxID=185978 RepID=UPI0036D3A003
MLLIYAIALLFGGLLTVNGIFAYQSKHIDSAFWTTVWFQFKLLPVFFAANVMIGYGIKFLHRSFSNLTFALTLSKGIEILVCIALGALLMKEMPKWNTAAGLAMVIAGFWLTRWNAG